MTETKTGICFVCTNALDAAILSPYDITLRRNLPKRTEHVCPACAKEADAIDSEHGHDIAVLVERMRDDARYNHIVTVRGRLGRIVAIIKAKKSAN